MTDVKAADVGAKVADVWAEAADVHRPLFCPKVADVVLKRPMSPKSKAADVMNLD